MATVIDTAVQAPTESLARFIADLRYEDIPTDVLDRARYCVLDNVANCLGGAALVPGRIVADYVAEMGGGKDATILASGRRVPTALAAFANSHLCNVLDFDDTYDGLAHPGATAIPPAVAVAEKVRASGAALLTAIVAAYEVSLRIGIATQPSPERMRQVWGLGTWQTFAAATGAAKLLGLDAERTRHAFGLAGSAAPLPYARKLGMTLAERPFAWSKNNYHHASFVGVTAAMLAARGFLGNRFILDGPNGFWIMMSSDRCDWARFTAGLGTEWLLPRTAMKPYASCRWTHSSIDAALRIIARGVRPEAVRRFRLLTFREGKENLARPHPENIIDAQFSLPYLVALCFAGHSPAQGLKDAHLVDPAVHHLAEQVEIEEDPVFTRAFTERGEMPGRLIADLEDGTSVEERVANPRGNPADPVPGEESEAKFLALAEPVLGPRRARRVLSDVLALDRVVDVAAWIRSWRGRRRAA